MLPLLPFELMTLNFYLLLAFVAYLFVFLRLNAAYISF